MSPVITREQALADARAVRAGQPARYGYVYLERQYTHDAIIVLDTPQEAEDALENHPVIDDLCQEDCLEAELLIGASITPEEIERCEIISIE